MTAYGLGGFSSGLNTLLGGQKKPIVFKETDGVAEVMAKHTSAKAIQIKEQLKIDSEKIASEERQIKLKQQTLSNLLSTQNLLKEKYKTMTAKKKAELVAEYKEVIIKLKTHPLVDKFSVDSEKRVIVTTQPLSVKKPTWDEPKIAGVYQIKIDFAQTEISSAIHILNCTQRHENHDSPTISGTSPCWGNISTDISNDFKTQDLYELVIDLIDYIMSPNDNDGYIRGPGATQADKKGWEAFFNKAKKMPKGYSFKEWDKNNNSGYTVINMDNESNFITYDPGSPSTVSGSEYFSFVSNQYAGYTNSIRETDVQRTMAMELERNLFLRSSSARHYAELIYPEGSSQVERIDVRGDIRRVPVGNIDFSDAGSMTSMSARTELEDIKMFVGRRGAPGVRDTEDIINLNQQDFTSEGISRLIRGEIFRFRPSRPSSNSDPRMSSMQEREAMVRGIQQSRDQLNNTSALYGQQMQSQMVANSLMQQVTQQVRGNGTEGGNSGGGGAGGGGTGENTALQQYAHYSRGLLTPTGVIE